MKGSLLSIVIPIYNCEQSLSRCLDSVLKQTYENLEIILINDGSTDQTDNICRCYASRDRRIQYICQQNQGVAYTRRQGVRLATGKYIGFLDADDYIDEDMYKQMVLAMTNAELVIGGHFYQGKKRLSQMPIGLYQKKRELEYFYSNMFLFEETEKMGFLTNLWDKLFLSEKLKKVVETTVLDIEIGEDAEILYKYILYCDSIYVSNICMYHYETNYNSITQTRNKNFLHSMNYLYTAIEEVLLKHEYGDVLLPKWKRLICNMVQNLPKYMGIHVEKKGIYYLNPYTNLLKGKRVILYGAGVVGKDFYKLYQHTHEIELAAWIDENADDILQEQCLPVKSPDFIERVNFDYILIAVKTWEMAEKIKVQLQKRGIENERILWEEPISMA